MRFTVQRLVQDAGQGTISILRFADAVPMWVMELPWRNNEPNVSRIPAGQYEMTRAVYTNRHGTQFPSMEVLNIPEGRWGVKWHPANFARQLKGCFAPGFGLRTRGEWMVTDSRAAHAFLMNVVASQGNAPLSLLITEDFRASPPRNGSGLDVA